MEHINIILSILLVVGWGILTLIILRRKEPFFSGRLTGLTLGFLGLWILIFDPNYQTFTPTLNVSVGNQPYSTQEDILNYPNVHRLLNDKKLEQLDTIFIHGIQFTYEDLDLLKGRKLDFTSGMDTAGIVEIEIPEMTAFQKQNVSGKSKGIISGTITLLQDERVPLNFFDGDNFSISMDAPLAGRYLLPLELITIYGDTIYEVIPIIVNEQPVLKILTISSFPDFELNFLRNHWASKGYGFVQRIQISKDKFQTSATNHPSMEVGKLTNELLSGFDVLHIDLSSWNGLSTIERNQILMQVEQEGLGVLLTPGPEWENPLGLPSIRLEEAETSRIFDTEIDFFKLSDRGVWRSLDFDAKQVGYVFENGFGKIVLLNFVNSYKLVLNSNKTGYQLLWAELFSEVYNPGDESFQLILSEPVFSGRKTEIGILGVQDNESYNANSGEETLTVNMVPFIESLGTTTIIPKSGWNKIMNANHTEWFYAFSSDNWMLMQANALEQHIAFLNYFANENISGQEKIKKALPWWVGLSLMIVGFGALWLIEKLY